MTDIHENDFEPVQFLLENVELLPKGQVLDVAMGSGRNAIYLAGLGFDVEGIDIAESMLHSYILPGPVVFLNRFPLEFLAEKHSALLYPSIALI